MEKQRYREQAYGRWQPFLIPSTGTRRRIQALQSIGWSQPKLAALLGIRVRSWPWIASPELLVERTTRDRIAALYEQLWNRPAPRDTRLNRQSDTRSRNYAAAKGWLPPAAWDDIDTDIEPPTPERDPDYVDQVKVDLACAGHRMQLSITERAEAVRQLNYQGLSDRDIAEQLGLYIRSVLRIRATHHIAPAFTPTGEPILNRDRSEAA